MIFLNRILACFALLLITSHYSLATAFQSHESITDAARNLINNTLLANVENEITFAPLDVRLQLPPCEQPLVASLTGPTVKPGRNSISVKCNGAKNWSLYVSAQVKMFQDVVVLTQPVQRGEILTENHLQLSHIDISQLRTAFFSDLDSVINKQAAHNLLQDAILNEHDVALAIIIKRGDTVTITSASTGLSIQMQGKALMDGTQGQSIRVKNTTSGRTISATVTKPGVVTAGL